MANPWDNDPVVKPVNGAGPWDYDPIIEPAPVTKSEQAARRTDLMKVVPGLGEMALSAATGFGASALGGIAGIGATITRGPDAGADAVRAYQDAFTYQPRGEWAQNQQQKTGAAMDRFYQQPLERVAGAAVDATGDPKVGAAVEIAPEIGLMMLGGKKPNLRNIAGKQRMPHAEVLEGMRSRAGALYDAAENSGLQVKGSSYSQMANRLEARLRAEGMDPDLHPKMWNRVEALKARGNQPISLRDMELERRKIADIAGVKNADESRIASIGRNFYDDYMETLSARDVLSQGGPTNQAVSILKDARTTWRDLKRAQTIHDTIEMAYANANTYTAAGLERALRNEFKKLLRKRVADKRVAKMFTDDEWKQISRVVNGGPVQNVLEWYGKMSGRSPVGGAVGVGAGYAVGGPIGAVAVPVTAEIAKRGAAQMGVNRANNLFYDIAGP
jgi:hypothetical protein